MIRAEDFLLSGSGGSAGNIGSGAYVAAGIVYNKYNDSYTPIDVHRINAGDISNEEYADNKILKKVTISGGVDSIGSMAFHGCSSLETVSPLGRLSSVGDYAFSYCSSLNMTEINTDSLGENAFYYCSSLKNIKIKCPKIKHFTFQYCTNLKSVWLSSEVTEILASANVRAPFYRSNSLTKIYLEGQNTSGFGAYWNYINGNISPTVYYNVSEDLYDEIISGV